jgi:hypothetical protein
MTSVPGFARRTCCSTCFCWAPGASAATMFVASPGPRLARRWATGSGRTAPLSSKKIPVW